jgi:hypothetical protein
MINDRLIPQEEKELKSCIKQSLCIIGICGTGITIYMILFVHIIDLETYNMTLY